MLDFEPIALQLTLDKPKTVAQGFKTMRGKCPLYMFSKAQAGAILASLQNAGHASVNEWKYRGKDIVITEHPMRKDFVIPPTRCTVDGFPARLYGLNPVLGGINWKPYERCDFVVPSNAFNEAVAALQMGAQRAQWQYEVLPGLYLDGALYLDSEGDPVIANRKIFYGGKRDGEMVLINVIPSLRVSMFMIGVGEHA